LTNISNMSRVQSRSEVSPAVKEEEQSSYKKISTHLNLTVNAEHTSCPSAGSSAGSSASSNARPTQQSGDKTSDKSADKPVSRPIMIIPAKTRLCPADRRDLTNAPGVGAYYITLDEEIEIELDTIVSVTINGSPFGVIDSNFNRSKYASNQELRNRRNLQSFIVPTGTAYHVNDVSKDPIGLLHILDIDQRFVIAPGSPVFLPKDTQVVLNDTTYIVPPASCNSHIDDYPPPKDVVMTLTQKTECLI
ncbi:hypothetical protein YASMINEVIRUS_1023, partial [Yasminevirus sp. GU-2018]